MSGLNIPLLGQRSEESNLPTQGTLCRQPKYVRARVLVCCRSKMVALKELLPRAMSALVCSRCTSRSTWPLRLNSSQYPDLCMRLSSPPRVFDMWTLQVGPSFWSITGVCSDGSLEFHSTTCPSSHTAATIPISPIAPDATWFTMASCVC